jgi:cytochrome c-type biogenesis protein CcmH/NrfF
MKLSITLATLGVTAIIGGTLLLWGAGVALVVAGVSAVAGAVVTYDPDQRSSR